MKSKYLNETQLADFKTALLNDEKSTKTVAKYMYDLHVFKSYVGDTPIDKSLVLGYKAYLEKKYTLSSANSMLAALNSFFKFAGWGELCVKQFKVQKKTYCSEDSELSRGDYIALINAANAGQNERLALVIQTICGTGIRVSELVSITAEAVRKGEAEVSCKGKVRRIFIVSALRKKLLKYAKKHGIESGSIFVTRRGKPLDRSNIWREMKSLCTQAGVACSKVFPHNLRHLFARTFYAVEKDIAKLADILGHSNINTTRIYIISTGLEHKRRLENMKLII